MGNLNDNFREVELDDLTTDASNIIGNLEGLQDRYDLFNESNENVISGYDRVSNMIVLLESVIDEVEDAEEELLKLLEHVYSLKTR